MPPELTPYAERFPLLPFHPLVGVLTGLLLLALGATHDHRHGAAWNATLALGVLGLLALHTYTLGGGRRALRVAAALTLRTWTTLVSYRFQALFLLVQVGLLITLLVAMSKPVVATLFLPVGQAMSAYTNTNYVVFLLLGLAAWPILWRSYQISSTRIRQEQFTGLFEAMVATPAGAESLPLAYLASTLIGSLVSLAGFLTAYRYILPEGALHVANPHALLAFAAALALSLITMWGLGLLIGGLTTLFKEAGSASNLLRFALIFFAGIYVPIDVLPAWAEPVSRLLPLTYTFEIARGTLADGLLLSDHLPELATLTLFALAASTGGMWAYRRLLDRARRAGTLSGY